MVIIYTDKEIFGFDVGSRAANIATLIALILVIIWLALSTAYCITRGSPPARYTHHNVPSGSVDRTQQSRDGRGPGRNAGGGAGDKSRRQRFEEYWGEMDSSTNSITPMHPTSDSESDSGSIEISDRILTNQVDGQVLSSPHHASLYQPSLAPLPPPPQPSQPTYQAPVAPILPKPPSDTKTTTQTADLISLSAPSSSSPPPPPISQSSVPTAASTAPQPTLGAEQVNSNSTNA